MPNRVSLQHWERQVEWPLALIALIFLVAFSVQVLTRPTGLTDDVLDVVETVSWAAFAIDYAVRLWLAPNRLRWFVRHLLDLAVVALPLLRPLRLLRLVILVGALQKAIGNAIRGRVMAYTICGAVLLVYIAALGTLQVEREDPDGSIKTFGQALWWAISTITTVSGGDEHPVTNAGRAIAVLLMIGGISLLGMITATLASWIVQRVAEEDVAGQAATVAHIDQLLDEIRALHQRLDDQSVSDR